MLNSPNTIGANIRAAREAKEMSQLTLAHTAGWTGEDAGSQISLYESGQREPRLSTLSKIAEALGTTIAKLLTTNNKHLAD